MNEVIKMAFSALGVNKLRSFLTMSGITIGVFSSTSAIGPCFNSPAAYPSAWM